MNILIENSIAAFLKQLSSPTPTPGGGSVAALAGANGAALVVMVARLTLAKPCDQKVRQDMELLEQEACRLQQRLGRAVDDDAQAYEAVVAAYRQPRGGEGSVEREVRSAAIQQALERAAQIPLQVAVDGCTLLDLADKVLAKGNKNVATDAQVAQLMARSAILGAICNVRVNLETISDKTFVRETEERIRLLENTL